MKTVVRTAVLEPTLLCPPDSNGGASLVIQRLRLSASTAGGTGSIPGRGTKTLRAAPCRQNIENIFKIGVG